MTNKRWYYYLLIAMLACNPLLITGQIQKQLNWEELPAIPDKEGFAGMFAGVSGDALICMGGTNFPGKKPWEGGLKKWYDQIFILEEGSSRWKVAKEKLPMPLAYGVSFTYKNQIILAGGCDAEKYYANVFVVSYNGNRINIDTMTSLPYPLANMTGALVGDVLFIAGGQKNPTGMPTKTFLCLNLQNGARNRKWMKLDPWPGPSRINAVSASLHKNFFLFSGICMPEKNDRDTDRIILNDAYKFVPAYNENQITGGKWIVLAHSPRGLAAGPSPAPTVGLNHLLFPGGLDAKTAKYKESADYPGFVTDVLAYNAESDTWMNFGSLSKNSTRLTVPVVYWDRKWVIPNGEMRPGERSPKVFAISKNLGFGWINWATLIIYLCLMLWMGFIFDKKGQTTKSFFTANGKIPWWAAGISIYGSQLSAITFMATPAIVFATDWALILGSILVLITIPIIIRYFVPFFRRLNITSAYEYLEHRFNKNVRLLGSITFILFQMGRMGIVLFLPAIAISSVTGIDVFLLIGIIGVICTIYTVKGGIEAVIWTDVIQVFILMGGAILCLFIAVSHVEGGVGGVVLKGMEAKKFTLFHLGWAPDKFVLWVSIVGFFFLNIIPYTSDQTVIQRYLTVKDEKATGKSLWMNAFASIPGTFVFFALGTVLFIFYKENPSIIPSDKIDEVLPYFIVQQLPVGIAGLVIAGIFAASQSALGSSMNSISASYITDIHQRFFPGSSDRGNLRVAKITTMLAGVFAIISATMIVILKVQFIFDLFQEVLGILGGALAGVFILGIFSKRANATGAIFGVAAGLIVVWLIKVYTNTNVYLYGAISVVSCVTIGYVVSTFTSGKKNLEGLTYSMLSRKNSKEEV